MKLDFSGPHAGGGANVSNVVAPPGTRWGISAESDRLTNVLLVSPDHLAPVACCSVTREKLRDGYRTDQRRARSTGLWSRRYASRTFASSLRQAHPTCLIWSMRAMPD
jgi:hypothetical protein